MPAAPKPGAIVLTRRRSAGRDNARPEAVGGGGHRQRRAGREQEQRGGGRCPAGYRAHEQDPGPRRAARTAEQADPERGRGRPAHAAVAGVPALVLVRVRLRGPCSWKCGWKCGSPGPCSWPASCGQRDGARRRSRARSDDHAVTSPMAHPVRQWSVALMTTLVRARPEVGISW
jgi:hypothetical protein